MDFLRKKNIFFYLMPPLISRAITYKSTYFPETYSNQGVLCRTVTRNIVMRRAADYLHLNKPNLAALNYTAAVQCSENLLYIADVVRCFFKDKEGYQQDFMKRGAIEVA